MAQAIVYRNKSLLDSLIVLRSSNPEFGFKKMVELSAKSNFGIDNVYPVGDFSVVEIKIPYLANLIFGDLFPGFKDTYCVKNDKYIFLTSSMESAKRLISDFERKNLLSEDRYFNEYAENIPESNYLIYSNIASSYESFKAHTSPVTQAILAQQESILKKFQAISLSWSNENDELFYQNLYLKFNPVFKEESNSIWEYRLENTSSMKPALVENHYSKAKEIFVQDDKNIIYLISNTGKLLWKKQLDEKIESKIYQVDIFKNNKLQMVFNTKNHIYVLDRNGDNVGEFPVKLDAPATNQLAVIDYSDSKEYRLMIACENNMLYNYDKKGIKVKGWAYKSIDSPIVAPVQLATVQNKDYLFALAANGKINALDRRGRVRLSFKQELILSKNNDYQVVIGNTNEKTFLIGTDSLGQIVKIFLDDRKEIIDLGGYSADHYFTYVDIDKNGSREYVIVDGEKLKVFDNAQKMMIDQEFESNITNPVPYKLFNQTYIGLNNGNELLMIDRTGKPLNGFPMKGSLPFSISDINKDGIFDLVAQDNEGNVLVYEIGQN